MWYPEITRQVIEAGMTVGTHTWSHKDLRQNPYAKDLDQAKQEIEMGNSTMPRAAAGAPVRRCRFGLESVASRATTEPACWNEGSVS